MLAVDERGQIVVANREAERLFGWSREELRGQRVETLVPERFRGGHSALRAGFLGNPHSRPMGAGRELYALRRDGAEFPVEIGLNPVRTARGMFVLVSVVDITARRKAEEDLRRTQRLETIGILAGGIAHDFNNILLGIVGHTELALREVGTSRQVREDLEQVLTAADRGRQLVQRILTFSRETKSTRAPLRLDAPIQEVVQLLRASLPSTIEIRSRIAPDAPAVLADETQVHQILMNLVTNSAQAMAAGGVIDIGLGRLVIEGDRTGGHAGLRPGTYARLAVSDSGAGMPPEVLQHALEPFFTTKAPGQGSGLGLSVVHGIVSAHGGAMEIASQPGAGTTITIHLPAVTGGPTTSAQPRGEEAGDKKVRVLLVEDEELLAKMQRRQLEYLGFRVTAYTSSLEALERFRADPKAFDLLITDETMPRMTGSRLVAEMLQIRPDLPVLMVSGGDRTEPGKERPPGVRKVLRKPHTAEELEASIREVLGSQARA